MIGPIPILIVDDDRAVCSSLQLLFKKHGCNVKTISHPNVVMETIETFQPQIVVLDMNFTIDTSGKQGIKLLKMIREAYTDISVILMTGWATVQLAVEGMKIGAKDFIAKPWDNKHLVESVKSIIKLYHPAEHQESETLTSNDTATIVGESEAIQDILLTIEKVAPTHASILITGQSGTGKELVAEAIHNQSLRSDNGFVKVNLGAIPSQLFESEMFGYKKGAFTGADQDREGRFSIADKGTIFLDEVGELDLTNQVKLLRVLQERTFEKLGSSKTEKIDVRIISATNRNLISDCQNGKFREDLYYRLNLLHIHLPSLNERRSDIPLLVKHFCRQITELYNATMPYINEETLNWLSAQEYKGNIRQLKNIVERTLLMNLNKTELGRREFENSFDIHDQFGAKVNQLNLQELEIDAIKKALAKYNHSISASAKALGITRSSLYRRLEKYNIKHEY